MSETLEHRLKRLRMRSWRRGIKEMDLLLGPYSDMRLAELTETELDQYELVLSQNDQDLYAWVSGKEQTPPELSEMLGKVRDHHGLEQVENP